MDGTLIDSLQGILDAINLTFKQLGFKIERSYEEAKFFIGAGAIEFARRAMKGQNIPNDKEQEIMESFLINYARLQTIETKPFPGIIELLKELQSADIKVCIASNKPQVLLDPVVKELFPNFKFDLVFGSRPNRPEKPDPYVIYEIMKELNVEPNDCVYVGDSEYDYLTSYNAAIDLIITKYGYGFYDRPWIYKVKQTVESVSELKEKLI